MQRLKHSVISTALVSAFFLGGPCQVFRTVNAAEPDSRVWDRFLNGGNPSTEVSLPIAWQPDSGAIVWQADLIGYGQSSPVSYGGKVFVTSTSGDKKEQFHVTSLSLETGGKLWQADFANPTEEENTSYVSRAAPTPVVDRNGIYVSNEGGVIAALDFAGKVQWTRDLVAEFGPITARHGLAASPEQNAEHLFVWIERSDQPYLIALEKATGKTVWKVDGLGATSWSSPRLISVEGEQHLVCSASGKLVGFDPASGAKLWESTDISNNTSCTPIPLDGGQFFIGASDGRGEENAGKGASSNGLIQVQKLANGEYSVEFVWRAAKASCSFGSPLVAGGRVWIVNRAGALYQLDLSTGEQLDASRVKAGGIWATPLAAAGKIYLFGQKGITSVLSIEDGGEIATNKLWDVADEQVGEPNTSSHTQYAAAVAENTLLIRRGDRVYALRN